jgi:hypothetical protein
MLKSVWFKNLKTHIKDHFNMFRIMIHHQGVLFCACLKLHKTVHLWLLCARPVFGGIFRTCGVCVCVCVCVCVLCRVENYST